MLHHMAENDMSHAGWITVSITIQFICFPYFLKVLNDAINYK
ncbi:putative membrane protein [Escherichia coli EC96038]|nr:putative membrane protein [Escherichia coli EC96038]EKK65899.1 putative membrane protein [Escherichia coli 10.0869]